MLEDKSIITKHNKLPDNINSLILGKEYKVDRVGFSTARILILDDSVLKIVKYDPKNDETIKVMRWLDGKLPIPKVLSYEQDSNYQYLLMSKVPGRMCCEEYFEEHPQELLERLSEAIKMLSSVDISDCPRDRNIDVMLDNAKYLVENNLVGLYNEDCDCFRKASEGREPEELLSWLENNKPDYEPVFSHGDCCFPNIFVENNKISGFVDLGRCAVSDKWNDIALCYRNLPNFLSGKNIDCNQFFKLLNVKPNFEKLRYFKLLDLIR